MSGETPPANPLALAPPAPPSGAPVVSPQTDLVQQFLSNQAQEIAIRGQEVALRVKEVDSNHEYAKRALDAQAEDRKDERRHKKDARRDRLKLAALGVLILGAFVIFALYLDKDALALEALKVFAFLGAGGLGGYGLRRVKDAEKARDDPE